MIRLSEKEIKIVEQGMKDYSFIYFEIVNEIFRLQQNYDKNKIMELLANDFLNRFKDLYIYNFEDYYYDEMYIDFRYKDITSSVSYYDNSIKVLGTFDIYNKETNDYIDHDCHSLSSWAEIINNSKQENKKRLEEDKRKIKEELEEELREKFGEIELNTIKKYENKYNISWSLGIPITIDFVLFEDIKGDKND